MNPEDIYKKCDDLDSIPALNRRNYEYEQDRLVEMLPKKARVLQVGSMDGMRAVRLLEARPDLELSGLEIDQGLVKLARENLKVVGYQAEFVCGDITQPPRLPRFDYVVCLNHTLGYIPDERQAIEQMRLLGKNVVISVFGELFSESQARKYFVSIGLVLENSDETWFSLRDFTKVRRFTRAIVEEWGGEVKPTPLGYMVVLQD